MKKTTTLSVSSTTGWAKGLFIKVDDDLFVVDRVMNGALAVHKPGWLERKWRAFVNRTNRRWYRLRNPKRW